MRRLHSFWNEISRRKVFRVVVAYLAVFASVTAYLATMGSAIGVPPGIVLTTLICGIALIPVVATLAWRYDIVPPQLVRDFKDIEAENPGLSWARMRHDAKDAGCVLLVWSDSESNRLEKRFFRPVSIGRETNNDIEFADERVSRHHAVIWAEHGLWHIRDLDSANGTFVGHARVSRTQVLPLACDLRFHVNGPIVSFSIVRAAATRVG
jgi:hypothetical protein